MNFALLLIPKEIKEVCDMLPGTFGRYPMEVTVSKGLSVTVTLPVIPDDDMKAQYANAIKTSFDGTSSRLIALDVQFAGFADVKELSEEEVLKIVEEQKKN